MESRHNSASPTKNTSKDLLSVTGDGSSKAVIESLFKRPKVAGKDRQTFQVARSPLFDQLQTFLPEFRKANESLLSLPQEQIDDLNIESTDGDNKVVEMNLMIGEMGSEDDNESEEMDQSSAESSDSEDDTPVIGPVTANNMKLPSGAKPKKGKNLVQLISEPECDKSDSEMTVSSTSSGER